MQVIITDTKKEDRLGEYLNRKQVLPTYEVITLLGETLCSRGILTLKEVLYIFGLSGKAELTPDGSAVSLRNSDI
jgi:hypothetical protein